jgi:hypothetical protein
MPEHGGLLRPVVSLNVRYRERELGHMLNQSGTRLVISSAAAGDTDLAAFYSGFLNQIPGVEQVLFLGGRDHGPATGACPPIRATRRWRLAWTIWRLPSPRTARR